LGKKRTRSTAHSSHSAHEKRRPRERLDAFGGPRHLGAMESTGELDCLQCGACCRQASDGRILVPAEDLVRWKRQGRADLLNALVPGHFGELAFAYTQDGVCVHLGTSTSPHACRIYEDRGTTCREFERGSWQCHQFRREAGLEPAVPRVGPER
jgi:Fe-S-cluster containining protein